MTYHRKHSKIEDNGRGNDDGCPGLELESLLFSIVAVVVVLLGDLYSAADEVMSHSSAHGCGEMSLRLEQRIMMNVSVSVSVRQYRFVRWRWQYEENM